MLGQHIVSEDAQQERQNRKGQGNVTRADVPANKASTTKIDKLHKTPQQGGRGTARARNVFSQVSAELVVAAALGEVSLGRQLVGLVQQVLGQEVPQQQVQRRRLPDLVVPVVVVGGGGVTTKGNGCWYWCDIARRGKSIAVESRSKTSSRRSSTSSEKNMKSKKEIKEWRPTEAAR